MSFAINSIILGNLKAQQKYRESQRKKGSHVLVRNNSKKDANNSMNASRKEDFVRTQKEVETNNEDK